MDADLNAPGTAATEDAALVARLRGNDPSAFEVLVRTYTARLLAVARRILDSEDDARDAVQEAFIAAFRGFDRFEGESRISTWLHRIVVNTALMKLRGRKRRPEEPLDPLLPAFQEDGHHVEQFHSWEESAERAILRNETRAMVRGCIDRLPESYRTVLLLRDIEGLENEEAAAVLGISVNAAKIRLHRARQALRTLLDPHFRGGVL